MNSTSIDTGAKSSGSFSTVLIVCVLILSFFFDFDIYYIIASAIFFHQFLSLYYNIGKKIPIRNLVGTMFSLNYLFAPALMFAWLNPYIDPEYSMRGDPQTYFNYAIPSIILFIIGLNIKPTKNDEALDVEKIRKIAIRYPSLALHLIIIGLVAFFIKPYVPSDLEFIPNSIAYFRFVGLFLSILSGKRFNILYFLLSYGMLIVLSLADSMFNDLLNMLFFLSFFLAIRYKPSNAIKLAGIGAGIGLMVLIQIIKFPLREMSTNNISDLKNLSVAFEKSKTQNSQKTSEEKIADVIFRVGQGWVTSSTIEYYEHGNFELQHGKHAVEIVKTAITPRLLDANRILLGDATWFNKYSGLFINAGTSIALGILSDGFIDYGFYGILIVGLFGFIFNLFIRLFHKMNDIYVLAKVFLPICFFYMRPDSDTHGTLGAVLKTTLIVWMFLIFLKMYYIKEEFSAAEIA